MTPTAMIRRLLTAACLCVAGLAAPRASADYIDYSVTLNRHWHSEYGSSGGNCWETGDEEYSGKTWFMLSNDGSWLQGTCYTINNNGDATKTINALVASRTTQADSTVLDVDFEAWEDDSDPRDSYNGSDDCHFGRSRVVDDMMIANASYRDVSHEYGGYGGDDHKTYFSIWWNWSLPPAPTTIAASALAQTSFTANWSGPSGYRVTNYKLYVATDAGFANPVTGYNGVDMGTATSRSITSLTPGQTYYYRVTAANERGTGDYSSSGFALTLPAAPGVGAATSVGTSGFTANWSASTGAVAYYLDVATDLGFTAFVAGLNNRDCGAATSQALTGLAAGQTYYLRVRAGNASGTSGSSATQSVLTQPAAPTALAPDNVQTTSFRARWNAVTGATAYLIDVATDASFTSFVSGYNGKNVAGSTSETVAGLQPSGVYHYRVRALNASGTGQNSGSQTVTLICETPTGLIASDAAVTDRVNLFWNTVTGAASYQVYRHTLNDSATATPIHSGSDTFFADTGALPHTTHYYWVRAINAAGASAYSASDAGSRKNATPSNATLSNSSLNENAGANATVGSLDGTDADDTAFIFTLVSGTGSTDNGLFNISGSTLRTTSNLDHEAKPSCSIRVRMTDPYGATYEKVFTVQVLDVNEPPALSVANALTVAFNGVAGPVAVAVSDIDSDAASLTLSASSDNPALLPDTAIVFNGTGANRTVTLSPITNRAGSAMVTVTVSDGVLTAQANITLTVEKGAQAIDLSTPADRTYGDAPFTLEALSDSGLPVGLEIASGPAILDGASVTLTSAGIVILRASQAGDENYEAATDVEVSFTVNPKALTVTADAKAKTYGDADPELTYTATGLVGEDTLTGVLTRAAGEDVGTYAIGVGTLDAGANYTLAFTGATFTITAGTTPEAAYGAWAGDTLSAYPEAKRAFEEDANDDGVPNGIAFAFGDALATMPLLDLRTDAGSFAVVTPGVCEGAEGQVDVVVEASADLNSGDWSMPVMAPESTSGRQVWHLAAPAPRAFFRVRVTLRDK